MTGKAAITIGKPRDEVERLWRTSEYRVEDAAVTFVDAPGNRGTEIHVQLRSGSPAGRVASRTTA